MANISSEAGQAREGVNAPIDNRSAEPDVSIDSAALMSGRREVTIVHGSERYRLRITANDKLILTK